MPRADVDAMAARLWQAVLPARKGQPQTWRVEHPSGFSRLTRSGAFNAIGSPTVRAVLDELLGAWQEPRTWGPPLITFPGSEPAWSLPTRAWHFDSPAYPERDGARRLARVFVILEPLPPRSGTTVIAEGSHRLAEAEAARAGRVLRSAEIRQALNARHAWFAELGRPGDEASRIRRFMDETTIVEGAPLRAVEMTGEPGDLWVMHPNCLHAGSTSVGVGPRMTVTQWVNAKPG